MKKLPVLHPVLLALYPVLFLFSRNMDQFSIRVLTLPVLFTLGITALFWLIAVLIFKNNRKTAMILSLFLLIFFSHGHLLHQIREVELTLGTVVIGANKILFALWFVVFVFFTYRIIRTKSDLEGSTRLMNVLSAALVLVSLVTILTYQVTSRPYRRTQIRSSVQDSVAVHPENVSRPDIFYIILDGYARQDVLREIYNYDNLPLVRYLAERGFFVARKSRSNYIQTALSMASSFNYMYLDDLVETIGTETNAREPLANMIRDNRLFPVLKRNGYQIITFSAGNWITDIKNSDKFLYPKHRTRFFSIYLDEFQTGLLRTTLMDPILKVSVNLDLFETHRDRVLFTFNRLREIPEWKREAPLFVYAHILCPHPPFIFDENGHALTPEIADFVDGSDLVNDGKLTEEEYITGYRNQILYINQQIRKTVDQILEKSESPPVIVLQGDHGPGSQLNWESAAQSEIWERVSILNAYHLPSGGNEDLYDSISPVNTFRIILNRFFGYQYELLEDRSYYSTKNHPYRFVPFSTPPDTQ